MRPVKLSFVFKILSRFEKRTSYSDQMNIGQKVCYSGQMSCQRTWADHFNSRQLFGYLNGG